MKEYLITLIAAAMAVSIFEILSPTGMRGAFTRHTRLLTGLLLICVLIAPLRGVIDTLRIPSSSFLRLALTPTLTLSCTSIFQPLAQKK